MEWFVRMRGRFLILAGIGALSLVVIGSALAYVYLGKAAAPKVLYISPTGLDTNPCTKDQPCRTIGTAVAAGKPFVKLAGTFDEAVTLSGVNVHILAELCPTLTRTPSAGPVLTVQGSSNVKIDDVVVRDALGGTGDGIRVPSGEPATLTLDHVSVIDNSGIGVNVLGGALKMSGCTVSGNKAGGAMLIGAGVASVAIRSGN